MRVLVACEFSGIVRDAFRDLGHDAVSCDILPSERPADPHYQGDVRNIIDDDWDLMIAHPPCTFLAVSGARWFAGRRQEQADALAFVRLLMDAPIPRIAIENPVSVISTRIRKPDQIVQPWMFGHGETKATCLWLKGLPRLVPTDIVPEREPRVHYASPGPDRWKERSRTLPGIARAFAEQWGSPELTLELPATPRESSDLAPHENSGSRNSSALAGLPVAEPPPGSFPVAATPATAGHKSLPDANPGAVSSPRGGSGDLPLQPGFGS